MHETLTPDDNFNSDMIWDESKLTLDKVAAILKEKSD